MKLKMKPLSFAVVQALSIAFGATAILANAQTAAPAVDKIEKIEVTGSRIPSANLEGTSPVTVVDAATIKTDGVRSVENLLNNSSTAAHEFGHTLGLEHPHHLDIRGQGIPGIMYPRGTWVDPPFQYYPEVAPGADGGTLNPFTRKVLQQDINALHLNKFDFDENGFAIVGAFSSVWHHKHLPATD